MNFKTYLEWNPTLFKQARDKNILDKAKPIDNSFSKEFETAFFTFKGEAQKLIEDAKRIVSINPQVINPKTRVVLTHEGTIFSCPDDLMVHGEVLLYMIYKKVLNTSVDNIKNWHTNPESLNYFVCLQTGQRKTNTILFSESYITKSYMKNGRMINQKFFGDLTIDSPLFIHYKNLVQNKLGVQLLLKQYENKI